MHFRNGCPGLLQPLLQQVLQQRITVVEVGTPIALGEFFNEIMEASGFRTGTQLPFGVGPVEFDDGGTGNQCQRRPAQCRAGTGEQRFGIEASGMQCRKLKKLLPRQRFGFGNGRFDQRQQGRDSGFLAGPA